MEGRNRGGAEVAELAEERGEGDEPPRGEGCGVLAVV
jgi:hypothetical protein